MFWLGSCRPPIPLIFDNGIVRLPSLLATMIRRFDRRIRPCVHETSLRERPSWTALANRPFVSSILYSPSLMFGQVPRAVIVTDHWGGGVLVFTVDLVTSRPQRTRACGPVCCRPR